MLACRNRADELQLQLATGLEARKAEAAASREQELKVCRRCALCALCPNPSLTEVRVEAGDAPHCARHAAVVQAVRRTVLGRANAHHLPCRAMLISCEGPAFRRLADGGAAEAAGAAEGRRRWR